MWPFKKKKKKEEAHEDDSDEDAEESKIPEDAGLSQKVEMMAAELTKINGTLESFKETRKSTAERFATMNEQTGEIRGMINDLQRTTGMIEVKATKAADLVESVHPDKLMIQVQKEDGKIEGLRGMIEAKEEMMKNVMDQVKKLRDQINVFRGIEQVIKLNEEVKDELMSVKKIAAAVERHADRVDNVFIEAQKSFEAFNAFSDKLDSLKGEQKEIMTKLDKVEVAAMAAVKKKDFDAKLGEVERFDKGVKRIIEDVDKAAKGLDERFHKLQGKLRSDFDYKIQKAELLSKAFEDVLTANPLFAKGLKLEEFLKQQMGGDGERQNAEGETAQAPPEGVSEPEGGDGKKEGDGEKQAEEKKG